VVERPRFEQSWSTTTSR